MNQGTIYTPPRRKRGGGWLRLLVVLIGVGAACYGTLALLAPWGFHMGGGFHWIPMWQGWGRMHSNSAGGDYAIYLYFYPSSGRLRGLAYVSGQGILCTPPGERVNLRMGGDFLHNSGTDLNGAGAHFYLYDRTATRVIMGGPSQFYLELKGKWANPDLVMDDHSSLQRNFGPDGKPWPKGRQSRPYMGEVVPVTLKQGTVGEFEAACSAMKR
jgi:hypothetical protein